MTLLYKYIYIFIYKSNITRFELVIPKYGIKQLKCSTLNHSVICSYFLYKLIMLSIFILLSIIYNAMLSSELESLTIDYKTIALPIKLNQLIILIIK